MISKCFLVVLACVQVALAYEVPQNQTTAANNGTDRSNPSSSYAIFLFLSIPTVVGIAAIISLLKRSADQKKSSEKAKATASLTDDSPSAVNLEENHKVYSNLSPSQQINRSVSNNTDELNSHKRMFTSYSNSMSGTPKNPLLNNLDTTNSGGTPAAKVYSSGSPDSNNATASKFSQVVNNVNMSRWLSAQTVTGKAASPKPKVRNMYFYIHSYSVFSKFFVCLLQLFPLQKGTSLRSVNQPVISNRYVNVGQDYRYIQDYYEPPQLPLQQQRSGVALISLKKPVVALPPTKEPTSV